MWHDAVRFFVLHTQGMQRVATYRAPIKLQICHLVHNSLLLLSVVPLCQVPLCSLGGPTAPVKGSILWQPQWLHTSFPCCISRVATHLFCAVAKQFCRCSPWWSTDFMAAFCDSLVEVVHRGEVCSRRSAPCWLTSASTERNTVNSPVVQCRSGHLAPCGCISS